MRRALALFALSSCIVAPASAAQRALAQSVTLPTGVTVARVCTQLSQEGVVVTSIDDRALPSSGAQVLDAVAQRIARDVDLAAGNPPRTVMYGALLLRTGAMTRQFPVQQSDNRTLDSRVADVLSNMPIDGDSMPGAIAMPDSLRVAITFGQHADGSPFVASHTRCPAVPYPDNSAAELSPRTEDGSPRVALRATVTADGRVDTASARPDERSDDRYIDSAMAALAKMRFVPAEFDGTKVSQRMTIVVPFAAVADSLATPATR